MKITKEISADANYNVGLTIFTNVITLLQEWRTEFEAIKNIQIEQSVFDGVVLDSLDFAIYYIVKRSKGIFYINNEEEIKFRGNIKEVIIDCLSNFYFDSEFKDSNFDKHKSGIEEIMSGFEKRMKIYSEYKGENIFDILVLNIMREFNNFEIGNIRFAENTFINRIKIGLAKGLGGKDAYFANDKIFDLKIIKDLVKSLTESLISIDLNKIYIKKNIFDV